MFEFRRCSRADRRRAKQRGEIDRCAFVVLECRRESCRPGGHGRKSRWPYLAQPATGRPYAHWRRHWKSACRATRASSHRRFPIPTLRRARFFQSMNSTLVLLFSSDLWTFILLRKWVDDMGLRPRLPPGAFLFQLTKRVKNPLLERSPPTFLEFAKEPKPATVQTQGIFYSR